jgi:hypothetical protein
MGLNLGRVFTGLGNGLLTYYQIQESKRRADQDDAFSQARIDQANTEMAQHEQDRVRSEAQDIAQGTAKSLENAGIYGVGPGLAAIAGQNGNRTQGQQGTAGAVGDYATSALDALQQASDAGTLDDNKITDLGQGRHFVGSHLGDTPKPVMGSPEWLSAMEALIGARGAEQRKTNAAKPVRGPSPTAAKTADAMLQKEIDRYVSEAGGDSGKAMTTYFQNNRMGAAQSPEEAAKLSDLQTRFNSSAQGYRNKTVSGMNPAGTVREKGKIPLSAVSKGTRQEWAAEAGIKPSNDPQTVARFLDWVRANHPEVDVELK